MSSKQGEAIEALRELVARCDGAEGVRADGSNIQTMRAHAALQALEEEQREERQRGRDGIGTPGGGIGGRSVGRRPQGSRARSGSRGGGVVGGDDAYGMGAEYGMGDSRSRGRTRGRRSSSTTRGGTGLTDTRRRSSSGRSSRGRTGEVPYEDMMYGDMMGIGGRDARFSPINEVYDKYDEMVLNRLTEWKKLEELTFWAHDDSVEPEKTYRYRIRLGVFNPIAGTDKVSKDYQERKNNVILWSEFSEVTEPVEIMGRLYFFANNVREADKARSAAVNRVWVRRFIDDDEVIGQRSNGMLGKRSSGEQDGGHKDK